MTSRRNQFHFTETIYLCLRSLRGPCIVTADSWANSPKGGDAKPPVYGDVSAYDSGVAGPNVSALRSRGSRATCRSDTSTDPTQHLASLPLWRYCIPVQGTWTRQDRIRFSATIRASRVMPSAVSPVGVGRHRQALGSVRLLTFNMTV